MLPAAITATQLAIDCQIEQRQIAMIFGQLQTRPNVPDMLGFEWAFLANNAAFITSGITSGTVGANGGFEPKLTDAAHGKSGRAVASAEDRPRS